MDRRITDREVYPALLITTVLLCGAYGIWRWFLHAPTIIGCWIYQNWHLYCPGCGGTRAVEALARGELLRSLYYHPAVLVTALGVSGYLLSQTVWRLRGRRGWVLRYRGWWPYGLMALLLGNCLVRNLLLVLFGMPI